MSLFTLFVMLTLAVLSPPASAWNIPGHMLSGAIAYQVLQQESPQTIDKVKAALAKHPWYINQWQARVEDVPTLTATWCCSCRPQSGLMIYAATTNSSTVRCGIISTGPLSLMDNHQAYKPESLKQ